jgi:hypothetical protein
MRPVCGFAKKRDVEFKQKILGVLGVLAVQEDLKGVFC